MSCGSRVYFDGLGASWDELRREFYPTSTRDRALDRLTLGSGHVAADVGAGTGFLTEALVARGLKVLAIDRSASMLAALRRKFPDPGVVECRTGNADRIPIEDASVDLAMANMLLHHVEHPGRVLREMARIVRPGGCVVVTDLDRHDHEFLITEHHDRWMGFARDDIQRWLIEAGLCCVSVDDLGEHCCATSSGGRSASVSIFFARGHRHPRATGRGVSSTTGAGGAPGGR
jgi:SAM-dependent methyltransferase